MDRPVIFLSAVSAEFRELRQLLHDSFKTHFHVITQDDTLHKFPGGDVRQLLSDAIDGSHAVLHLAGAGFGSTAAPFPEMPGFLCSWTQYEYYYAHSFDADPVLRKQIFAIVCGPTLRSPTFSEKDDATLTAAQKAPLQEAHCQRIFSGKFDATPLASLPRTVNHGQPINDNAAALRAAIDICAQLATRQPAFQSACALVQVSLEDQFQPLLQGQQEIKRDTTHLRRALPWLATGIAATAAIVLWVKMTADRTSGDVKTVIAKFDDQSSKLDDQANLLKTAVVQLEQLTEEKSRLGIKITDLPREAVEKELAARVGVSAVELRLNIDAGKKSQDALTRQLASLLARDFSQAHTAAKEVREARSHVIQELFQSHQAEGQTYYQESKYEAAIESFQIAAALVDKKTDPLSWADAQSWVTFLQVQHLAKYSEAEPLMRESLRIREHFLGPNHGSTANTVNNLAELCRLDNRPDEAKTLVHRALSIAEASYGLDHPNTATVLNNLAMLHISDGEFDKAEILLNRALKIDEAKSGQNHESVARDLNNLAHCLLESKGIDVAKPFMIRATDILENKGGNPLPDYATAIGNLTGLLVAEKHFDEAEKLTLRQLQITEDSVGVDHPDTGIVLNNLAGLLNQTDRLPEAEKLSLKAVRIFLLNWAQSGHRNREFFTVMKNYLLFARDTKVADPEIHARLDKVRKEVGLESVVFEAVWQEVVTANPSNLNYSLRRSG